MNSIGQVLHSFFEDHLKTQRGLRPSSICSYRDTIKLFLLFVTIAKVGRSLGVIGVTLWFS